MNRLVNDLPLLPVCPPLLAALCLKSPLAVWMVTICGTCTNSHEVLWDTSMGSQHSQPGPDLGPTHSGAKRPTEDAVDAELSLVAMQGWYKRCQCAMSLPLLTVKGNNWWWPHLCSHLCQEEFTTAKDFMQIMYIHLSNVQFLLPESSAGRDRNCFYSPSPPFFSDSLSLPLLVAPLSSPLSQCLFPCFFFHSF